MTVTAIEPVTRHKMRVSIDGEPAFVFTDREIRDWQLTEEMELDADKEKALTQHVSREAARMAMNLLLKRDYGREELYRKLKDKGFGDYFAQQGIAYVISYHYVDDERYARQMAASRKGTVSRKMLINKMKQKGLADEVIRDALEAEEWNDSESLYREIQRRFSSSEQIESLTDKERQKMIQSLMRKGYGYSDIRRAMRHFEEAEDEMLWN